MKSAQYCTADVYDGRAWEDRLKDKKVRAIIISSRSPTLDAKAMMEKRGVVSKHLLAQPPGGGEFRVSVLILYCRCAGD